MTLDHTIVAKIQERLTRQYDGDELARHISKLITIVENSPESIPIRHIAINSFIRRTFV